MLVCPPPCHCEQSEAKGGDRGEEAGNNNAGGVLHSFVMRALDGERKELEEEAEAARRKKRKKAKK